MKCFEAAANEGEKYGVYASYLEHEKEPVRIAMLYERALVHFCLSPDFWAKHLDFLVKKFIKITQHSIRFDSIQFNSI